MSTPRHDHQRVAITIIRDDDHLSTSILGVLDFYPELTRPPHDQHYPPCAVLSADNGAVALHDA